MDLVPKLAGGDTPIVISDALEQAIHTLYAAHRSCTYQLHYDNLQVWVEEEPELGPLPAYATVRRYMKIGRADEAAQAGERADRRDTPSRAPARRARGPQLRERVRQRALAPGLPFRQQEGAGRPR